SSRHAMSTPSWAKRCMSFQRGSQEGAHSVGVAPQYASALGKTANCPTLVSLTLARGEVSVMLALRLFYHGDNPAVGSASTGRRLLDALIPVDDVAGCPRTR